MKVRNKKQLALLVGMALSVTVGVGMNPMDAYAEVNVSYDATSGYVVSYKCTDGKVVTKEATKTASEAAGYLKTALSTDSEGGTINTTQWDSTVASNLLAQMSSFNVAKGATVTLTDSNGTYSITAGNRTATIENVSEKNFKVATSVAKVTANNDATITVAYDAVIDEVEVSGGTVTINQDYETTHANITRLSVSSDTTIKGNYAGIAEVNVASNKKVTFDTTSNNLTVGDIVGAGDVAVTGGTNTLSTGKISTTGKIEVAEGSSLTATDDVSAASISGKGDVSAADKTVSTTSGDIDLGTTGSLTAGVVTAKSVTAREVKVGSFAAATDVTADTLTFTGTHDVTTATDGTYAVKTLKTSSGNLTISDAFKLSGTTTLNAAEVLSVKGDVSSVTTLKSGGAMTLNSGAVINPNAEITSGGAFTNSTGSALSVKSLSTGDLNANSNDITATDSITINGAVANAGSNKISAGTVELTSNANLGASNQATIVTDNLVVAADITPTNVDGITLQPATKDGSVAITIKTAEGADDYAALREKLANLNRENVTIKAESQAAATEDGEAKAAVTAANTALNNLCEFAEDADEVAQYDPFVKQLPSAEDVTVISALTNDQMDKIKTDSDLAQKIEDLEREIAKISTNNEDYAAQLTELNANLKKYQERLETLTADGMKAQAAKLTAATQQAGKTAAAPGISSARAAAIINDVMTGNVVDRTSELREVAAAVEDGRPAPDDVWFQYKHTNTEIGGGDVYNKSTVKTNNYQLGYDKKIGENDYLGAYIGTTTGSVEFNGPARSGDADIDSSFQFGIYGTHLLPANQYIDYMIHTGKFDTKYNGETWGTKDTGAMVGYGAKIAANDRLTWNPYIRLSYDKVSVDSYKAGVNDVSSDDSNNWTAKIGINLMDASGFYGGLAYSRGLSGSYNAYINGIAMPTEDFNANVIYLSLGYRANLSQKVFLDLSAEKTFADYKGWTAAGKVNFYF